MSEWQPIETAPKDGRRVLIFKDGWSKAPVAHWGLVDTDDGCFEAWTLEDEHMCIGVDEGVLGWNEDIEDGIMPTHWVPLPEPPK